MTTEGTIAMFALTISNVWACGLMVSSRAPWRLAFASLMCLLWLGFAIGIASS